MHAQIQQKYLRLRTFQRTLFHKCPNLEMVEISSDLVVLRSKISGIDKLVAITDIVVLRKQKISTYLGYVVLETRHNCTDRQNTWDYENLFETGVFRATGGLL